MKHVEPLQWKAIEWRNKAPIAWDAIAVDLHRRYRVRLLGNGRYALFINGNTVSHHALESEAKAAAQYDYGMRVDPKACDDGLPGSELLETIQEWSRLHDLNESVIAQKGTPSDSEIDFEVEAWTKIEKMASELITRKIVDEVIAAKVVEAKAELKARFVALCKDYAEDAEPATSYRQAMEDLVEALENGNENLTQPEPYEAFYAENDEVAELGEFLFQSEYQDDAKKLVYPKKHFERMATEVLAYFKDNNPDADAYREKFLAADERAVKWRNQSEAMRLRCEDNEKLLARSSHAAGHRVCR